MNSISILLADAESTEQLGAALAQSLKLQPGLVVFLQGQLGAGKTTLARGWLKSLGAEGPIRSPTYTLVEPYRLDDRELLHMDLYRLQDPEELETLGLDDYSPRHCWWLVEWPENGEARLPLPDLVVKLLVVDQQRRVEIECRRDLAMRVESGLKGFERAGRWH